MMEQQAMETDSKPSNMEAWSIEQGPKQSDQNIEDHSVTSAHVVGHDSWQQVALLLVTSYNCGFILSYSNIIMVPLGWTWGILCLIFFGLYTGYACWLLAAFHFIDGKRFIRFRDLMGYVYGKPMYRITWILQFSMLLFANIGFILLGARALKEINIACSDSPLRLQYFAIITGFSYFVFAFFIPTMSAMRLWLGASIIFTSIYVIIHVVVSIQDGISSRNKKYEISGSKVDKAFHAFAGISAILVSNAPGFLPEIQSTLRSPAVHNMRKALYLQFSIGITIYYGITIIGYWAYGSTVSWFLPTDISGPKWAKILASAVVFLQSIISENMFGAAIHETLDTTFLKLDEGMYSKENMKRRFILRGMFFTINTFVAAAFPFMADLVNLVGSFALIPLTFIFPSMLFIKVKARTASIEKKMWHWFNIIFFVLLTVATTTSAIRSFIVNIKEYRLFADL